MANRSSLSMPVLKLSIITPEKIVLEQEADEVVAPTAAGDVGILPEHAPLLARVIPGEMIVKKGKDEQILAVTSGFLQVDHDNLTILADYAVEAKDINIQRAEEAKTRAEKLMTQKLDDVDYASIEKEFARAIAELKVARKYKPR